MKCDQCAGQVVGQWRRICCGCGKWLHDSCWLDRLADGRESCCGGGWNLWQWGVKVTDCEAPEVEGEYPAGCRCERG
jgi:hypothetical protein